MNVQTTLLYLINAFEKGYIPIPPVGSNSFYTVGDGVLNLFCIKNDEEGFSFDAYIISGTVYTSLYSDDKNRENLFDIYKFSINEYGELECEVPDEIELYINDDGELILDTGDEMSDTEEAVLHYFFDFIGNDLCIFTDTTINIGEGNPFRSLTVANGAELVINDNFIIKDGEFNIHGKLGCKEGSAVSIAPDSKMILYSDSDFNVEGNVVLNFASGADVELYGTIDVHISVVDSILANPVIFLDSAAVISVDDIPDDNREMSLTKYETSLRDKIINPYTQGEFNTSHGRIGYTWKGGSPVIKSQILEISILWGVVILGDFRFAILGTQNTDVQELQVIQSLHICKGTTLCISETYNESIYVKPELYIGIIIQNCKESGVCLVDGTIIGDGINSLITIDRGGVLNISETGVVKLQNHATIRSTHNETTDEILFINGTLVLDDISQIKTLEESNIVFGENGKVIILNIYDEDHKLLWSTPNGIYSSELYRLFGNHLDKVEYHIQPNTGIGIDQYFERYNEDMTQWYNGMRIEKAIHEGMIVWHNGGFIELQHSIIPWARTNSTLLDAAKLFKTTKFSDVDKLQDVTERLKYAGSGNVRFRFIEGDEYYEVTLILDGIHMQSVVNKPLSDSYVLDVISDGELFIRNRVNDLSPNKIIANDSKMIRLNDGETEFQVP